MKVKEIKRLLKYMSFVLIIGLCIIFIVVCGLLSNKYGFGNPLEIVLLSLSLFATFGGAYFGAKISGDNSRKIVQKQLILNTLEGKMEENITIVNKFYNLRNKIYSLSGMFIRRLDIFEIFEILKYKHTYSHPLIYITPSIIKIIQELERFEEECSEERLIGGNISIPIIKDIEEVKHQLYNLKGVFEDYEGTFMNHVKSYIANYEEIDDWMFDEGIELISKDNGFYDLADDWITLKFEYKYMGKHNEIVINCNELWKKRFYIEKVYFNFKIRKSLRRFYEKSKGMKFVNENSIYNYLNKLYSDF